jgi:hypothetical protein
MTHIKNLNALYISGMLLILAGVILCLAKIESGGYLLGAGALVQLGIRTHNRWHAPREKERIYSIMLLSSAIIGGAAVTWFMGKNYWILLIFLAATLDVYASYRRI